MRARRPCVRPIMSRFVILRHETPDENQRPCHWDFTLQTDDVLRTWALAEQPAVGRSIAAEALADHRTAYLDYEGPLSGNRGVVARWDEGTYRIEQESRTKLVVTLLGEKIKGRVTLSRDTAQDLHWRVGFNGD